MAKTLLFISEDITLAQIVRLKALADSLPEAAYDIHFASSSFDKRLLGEPHFQHHLINVIDKRKADAAIAKCRRLYNYATLQAYVRDDLELIETVQPDLIIGDLRLSLPVSAEVAEVPYAALINAYWSPFAERRFFPMPDHPMERWLSYRFMFDGYTRMRPWVFRNFSKPINHLRKKHGLAPVGTLQDWLTHANYLLFPDTPELVPLQHMPSNQLFLGPIHWSPSVPVTDDIRRFMEDDFVYVTLGSSGRADRFVELLRGLRGLPVKVFLATADRFDAGPSANIFAAPYLPGATVAQHARLVISNGGSTTSYQALAAGTPVLGIASNLDQYLCMERMEALGAGKLLRGATFSGDQLVESVEIMLEDESMRRNAQQLARQMSRFDYRHTFRNFISHVVDA